MRAPKSRTVSFSATPEDDALIEDIVARAAKATEMGAERRMQVAMDLTACHVNGCPLKLRELLAADDLNFWHDVAGIIRNIDRRTGKLRNRFEPRFARRSS